jgi:hypothetical protein
MNKLSPIGTAISSSTKTVSTFHIPETFPLTLIEVALTEKIKKKKKIINEKDLK